MWEKNREAPGFSNEVESYKQIRDVMANYPMTPFSFTRDNDAWAMETNEGPVRVEKFRHSLPEFFFVLSAINFLNEKGFDSLPRLFNNHKGQPITQLPEGLFIVMEDPKGTPVNINEIDALTGITRHLAELHRTSVGFNPPPILSGVRQDWGDWEEKWQYRLDELYRLGEEAQHHKGEFEHLFLKVLDDFIQDGVRGLEELKALDIRTIIEEERLRGGLCQRDYKPANLLLSKDGYRLRDFDDFAGQSHLEDIARFIKEVGDWDPDKIRYIFDAYSEVYRITEPERQAILAYLKLPLDLWKVARSHYLRGKPQKQNLKRVVQEMNRRKRCFGYLEKPNQNFVSIGQIPWSWGVPADPQPTSSVDEYWNRWDWGNGWQMNIWNPTTNGIQETYQPNVVDSWNRPLSSDAHEEIPVNQEIISEQIEREESFESQSIPEEVKEMELVSVTAVEADDQVNPIKSSAESLQLEGSEQENIFIPEEIYNITRNEIKEEPQSMRVEPIPSRPKVAVWKAFPKPIA